MVCSNVKSMDTISRRCSSFVSSTTLCSSSASSPNNSNSVNVNAEVGIQKKAGDDTRLTQNLTRSDSKAATTTASTATAPAAATPRTTTTTAKRSTKSYVPSPEPKLKRRTTRAPSLVKLLKRRDFGTIRHMLLDSTVDVNSSWFRREYTIMGDNCLHYLLRFRPDSQTVSAMIYRLRLIGIQEPELSVDLTGRTPLHVAVLHGCDVSVIDTLLKANAGHISSRAQDVNGRVPLHYAIMMSTSPSTKTNSAFGFSPRGNSVENDYEKQTTHPFVPFPFLFMMKRRNKNNEPLYKKEWMYNILHTVKLLLGMSPETCLIMDDYHQLPVDVVDTFLHVHQEMSQSSSSTIKRLGRRRGRGSIRNLWKNRSSTNNGNGSDNNTLNEQNEMHKRIVSMIGDELRMSYELYTGTTPCRRIRGFRDECCCNNNNNNNVHPPHQPVVDPKLSMDIVVFSSNDSAGGFENDDDISILSTRF
mmetsp:Transcript_51691/g.124777  ORF Transcript_51691/g.124777 Transcript_51691/m.124777 type:complete len:473 (+) Transcript_51691:507-1925(+)|eukprot:CAMPEP_0113481908 /NCGR_PEP_ID=MMETSP0014_2-20120614/22649_1 /TAXON_ID=2857 /ORGANISM="Nitzschia sp." /LENGTH=472 /DNA_ID=CAMNT_0000375415 /DNA_START=202 /DNA_END=1620 /DNA_ORIENTATION=+ /assembly_acc=CAM_ASM_000159